MKKLCMTFCLFYCMSILIAQKDEDIILNNLYQSLNFSLLAGEVKATHYTSEEVQSKFSTPVIYKKLFVFDDNTSISKIEFSGKKIKPIVTNDLSTDEIFHSDSKIAYFEYDLSPKKIYLGEYTKDFQDYKFIDLLKFHNTSHDVLESEIEIEVPEWLDIKIHEFNLNEYGIKKEVKKEGSNTIYAYKVNDLKKFKSEKSSGDTRKYQPHLLVQLKSFTDKGKKTPLLENLSDLYTWYYSMASKIGNTRDVVKNKAIELTNGATTDEEKIKRIFYFVQDNIKYLAFENGIMGFKPEACQTVFNNKFGDCKGMANLLKEMLCSIGFDARLTWIGTNDIPYTYEIPTLYADNHMICTVLLNNEYIFLDGTEKHGDYKTIANRIEGREVLIENGNQFIRTKVPVQNGSMHYMKGNEEFTLENNQLKGTIQYELNGNPKSYYLSLIASTAEKNRKDLGNYFLNNSDNNISASIDSEISSSHRDKSLAIKGSLVASNQVIKTGKEYYVNIDLKQFYSGVKLEEDRKSPYSLRSKYLIDYTTNFKIPSGFKLKYLPTSISIDNEIGKFVLSYVQKGDLIQYVRNIEFKKLEILPTDFDKWRDVQKSLDEFYNDRMILEESK